jgi:hypothetical protein
MINKILFSGICCISGLYINTNRAFAQQVEPPKMPEVDKTFSAIKATVQGGLIRFIDNSKKASIALEWNPLPVTDDLVNSLIQYTAIDKSPITIIVEQGNNGKSLFCNMNREDLQKIHGFLGIVNGSDCSQISPDTTLRKKEIESLFGDGGDNTIRPSEYVAMSKERNILKTILSSKGIEYSFNFRREDEIEVPNFVSEKIKWKIQIYKYKWIDNDPSYYRFNIKAMVEPFSKDVPDAINNSFKLNARIRIKDRNKQTSIPNEYFSASITDALSGTTLVETKPPDTPINADADFTNLSGILSLVGGSENIGTTLQGFLSGTDNSSIISGGLLNFSNGGIDPLIGVNQEIGKLGDVSAGVVLGLGLGANTSIFLGPSIQTSIFTISAGARLGAREQSDLSFAGLVSIDLSRLSGSKKTVNTLSLVSPSVGGVPDIRRQIDMDTKLNTLMRYQSEGTASNQQIQLQRVCDAKGVPIIDDSKITIENRKKTGNPDDLSPKLVYLPKGIYKYLIPAGISVRQQDGLLLNVEPKPGVKSEPSVDLREIDPQDFGWKIESSPGSKMFVSKPDCPNPEPKPK